MKIRVVELFAGVGGFRLGLEGDKKGRSASSGYDKKLESNYEVVWSNQWEPSTKKQHANLIYEQTWGKENHYGDDINKVANHSISSTITDKIIPDHDLLVGGFPCQDYSVAGVNTDGIQGKKGVLWWNIHRILEVKRPNYVLLENVDRILKSPTNQRGRDFAIVLASMSDLGYDVEWKVINAADYGMPQRRRRVFIFGVNKNAKLSIGDKESWLINSGILYESFPSEPKGMIHKTKIEGELEELTHKYNKGKFLNSGIMSNRNVLACDFTPIQDSTISYSTFKTLSDVLEKDEDKIEDEFFVNANKLLRNRAIKFQKPGTKLSYLEMNGESHVELRTDLDKWKYLKGRKAEERKSSKGVFYYTEGPLRLADPIDQPARTIITSEGGAGPSRFKHLIEIEENKLYRRLTPIELEKLNMFPANHTKNLEVTDSRRAFLMGNALVVGIVERIGFVLSARIKPLVDKSVSLFSEKEDISISIED